MPKDSPYALLDPAEVERRAREKKNLWIEGASVVLLDVAAVAVTANTWPLALVIAAVVVTSGLGFVVVRRLELWWGTEAHGSA
jgi:hypothetical protein